LTEHAAPTVSFLVRCHNYGRYLGDCLRSIFAQRGGFTFEVIAVDDASTDDTADVLRAFASPELRVVTHAVNEGHIAALNDAFVHARGEFIARIDADDRYRPSFLEATLPAFARSSTVGLVYGEAALMNASGTITHEPTPAGDADVCRSEWLRILAENFICAPTAIARRDAWRDAMPIPPRAAVDDWYINVMIARRWDFCRVPQVVADYRVHPQNHHVANLVRRGEEPSVLWLLDTIFAEEEHDPERARRKRQARRHTYARHYLTLGRKYFGASMDADARRCLLRAIRHCPSYVARPDVLRWLAAACIGRRAYDAGKAAVKAAAPARLQ